MAKRAGPAATKSSGFVSRETPPPEPPSLAEVSDELERLQTEVQALVNLVEHEVGKKWMSLELRLQIEKVEQLLRVSFE